MFAGLTSIHPFLVPKVGFFLRPTNRVVTIFSFAFFGCETRASGPKKIAASVRILVEDLSPSTAPTDET